MLFGDDPRFEIKDGKVIPYDSQICRVGVWGNNYQKVFVAQSGRACSLSSIDRVVTVRTQYGDELRLYSGECFRAKACPCASDDVERINKLIDECKRKY